MNYRHVFHAGNFADVMKHAILLQLLSILQTDGAPLTVIDTHAGAGMYDLRGAEAARTGEAASGIARLMDSAAPEIIQPLIAAVRAVNAKRETRWYPGSPLLIARNLRNRDRLMACELRADDYASLKTVLPRQAGAEVLRADGFATARAQAGGAKRLLVLIDPPYERTDEITQVLGAIAAVRAASRNAVIALWAPIKDLDGFDALAGRVEDAAPGASILVAEMRLRPLDDPLRLNGSAMLVVNSPPALLVTAQETVAFMTEVLGEAGAFGRAAPV